MKNFQIVLFVLAAEAIGSLPSLITHPELSGWYKDLIKPWFTPPDWVFAAVWTFLFATLGVSCYLIYQEGLKKQNVRGALLLFAVQFALNLAWTYIFFGLRSPLFALFDITILWVLIIATIFKFYRISKTAGLLLLPYLIWITFAIILNYSFLALNSF